MIVDGYEMTKSHNEREIYEGCISLMNDLMRKFEDYLVFTGLSEFIEEDDRFAVSFPATQIVERLFLWYTSHSGHTSQLLKLKELGITEDYVEFKDERGSD